MQLCLGLIRSAGINSLQYGNASLFYMIVFNNTILASFPSHPPTLPLKTLLPTPLASSVSTSHPPPPPLPPLLTPSPSLLAAPPGRLIDSVPGGGGSCHISNLAPLLQIKATSLHPSTPPPPTPLQPLVSINLSLFWLFLIIYFLYCILYFRLSDLD